MSKNIGNIPGHYWDEEKQKYFRISTNHGATNAGSARYVEQNVKNLQRKAKRVKAEDRHANKLGTQTVKRSRVLQHSHLAGASFQRELGLRSRRDDLTSVHEAWLSMLRPASFSVLPATTREYGVFHQYSQPSWNGLVLSIELGPDRNIVLSTMRPPEAAPSSLDPSSPTLSNHKVVAEFDSRITSVALSDSDDPELFGSSIFVSAAQPDNSSRAGGGNAFSGRVQGPYEGLAQIRSERPVATGSYVKVGQSELENALSSAFNEGVWGPLVIGTNRNAYVHNQYDSVYPLSQLDVSGEYLAIDWLSQYIVTAGYIGQRGNENETHGRGVLFWDFRFNGTKASSLRFKIPRTISVHHRRLPNRPTGVIAMRKHGSQVLASDLNKIRLYDARMSRERDGVTEAVVEFNHKHDGQRLAFATNHDGIVVAANRDNDVVAYSTISGRSLRTLPRAATQRSQVARINSLWFEDKRENLCVVRACQGTDIVEWTVG